MTANIPINHCPFPVLGHHPFLVSKDLCVSCLEVIIALECDQGQGQGEEEHQEGGDDEAEDAGELNVQCWVLKWSLVSRAQVDAAHTKFWSP